MIRIQNIYYMLAYAFQVLNEQGYKNIATEEFDNTAELCAAILARGISTQVKRGLGKVSIGSTRYQFTPIDSPCACKALSRPIFPKSPMSPAYLSCIQSPTQLPRRISPQSHSIGF